MLLTRLVEYASLADRLPAPFYAAKSLRWAVELNADGSPASPRLTALFDASDRARRNGTVHLVPAVQRSGTASLPMLAADTAEYALGWATDDKRAGRAPGYHEAFAALVQRWHEADPCPQSAALLGFLRGGHQLERPAELAGTHMVAFRSDSEFAHDTESARRFWAIEAGARKGSSRNGLCLVCGSVGPLLQTIPQQLPTRLVPGATNNASLVSLNKAVHGYDLTVQLEHTPICVSCGLQAMAALEELLGGESAMNLPGQAARMAWWVTRKSTFNLRVLEDLDPVVIGRLLAAPLRGEQPRWPDEDRLATFCSLVVSGNVARVVVRDWIEQPLDKTRQNLGHWFQHHRIADAWTGEPRCVALSRLVLAAGRWSPGCGGKGSYVALGGTGAHRDPDLFRTLLAAALLGRRLPPSVLAHVVDRVRADGRVDNERAALIRLALRPWPDLTQPETYMPVLDPHQHEPSYLSGRIFAVLEDLQKTANRVRGNPPLAVTFADRYFGRGITSPAVVLTTGRRTARAWLKVLRRQRPSWAEAIEQSLDSLYDQLVTAGGMPHGTVLAEKSAFILGYHHQRAHLRAERATAIASKNTHDLDEPADAPEGATA